MIKILKEKLIKCKKQKIRNKIQDLYKLTYIRDGIYKYDKNIIKLVEVIPINICDMDEEKIENIIMTYKEVLKECNFEFKIIFSNNKCNIEEQVRELTKENTNLNSELLENYMKYIKELSGKKEIFRTKFYIVLLKSSVDNVDKLDRISMNIGDKINIFNKLENIGVKIKDIVSKEEIINILKNQILKGESEIEYE